MGEIPMSPEVQTMLTKAVEEITGLYRGEQLNNLLRGQSPQQRDQLWQEAAEKFPPFSDKITALRDALKGVEVTRRDYHGPVEKVIGSYFGGVKTQTARNFLTDVLFARITTEPGYMDYDMKVDEEVTAMLKELGVQDGSEGKQIEDITIKDAVASVLTGGLQLTRQTQLGEGE